MGISIRGGTCKTSVFLHVQNLIHQRMIPISNYKFLNLNKKVLKECKILVILYFRAYPSLKLRINVNAARNEVDVVMPGLRYDDIDFTGMLVVAKKITHTI